MKHWKEQIPRPTDEEYKRFCTSMGIKQVVPNETEDGYSREPTTLEDGIRLKHFEAIKREEIPSKITLDFLTNLAMRTDSDLELAKEVRRILGVKPSRRKFQEENNYLPCNNKL